MSAALHYYAPKWIEFALKDITAFPAKPLSSTHKLLLSHSIISIENQVLNNLKLMFKSLDIVHSEPWAAYCAAALSEHPQPSLSNQYIKNEDECSLNETACWMALSPCFHQVQLHKTHPHLITLSPHKYQQWIKRLRVLLSEKEWHIIPLEPLVLIGWCCPGNVDQKTIQPGCFEYSSTWLKLKTELEMSLFFDTQQGEHWEGMNSVQEWGSGTLPPGQSPKKCSTIDWTAWYSANSLCQVLSQCYAVPLISDYYPLIHQQGNHTDKTIWVDLSTACPEEMEDKLNKDINLWCKGNIGQFVLHSTVGPSRHFKLELPPLRWLKRRFIQWKIHAESTLKEEENLKKGFLNKIGF